MTKRTFKTSFLGSVMRYTAAVLIITSVLFVFIGKTTWIWSSWGGFAWIFINSMAVFHLLELVRNDASVNRSKIVWLCLIKFPILYLAGFTLLLLPQTSVEGVLVVFTIFLILVLISWLAVKRRKEV